MSQSDKLVVIHQPDFLPYLGFFHRLLTADIFIVLDNVQFVRGTTNSWMHRDKIRTSGGEKWLTIGIQKCPLQTKINDVLLSNSTNWRENHLNLLRENYIKASYFQEIYPFLSKLYQLQCYKMIEFNLASINMLMELLDVQIPIMYSSQMNANGKNNELVINLVKMADSTKYLSGIGARNYFAPELYEQAGIEVIWQEFEHPIYPQQYEPFIPFLSSIDLLFNCGIDASRKILRGGALNECFGYRRPF